jgi:hypothetical protein
MRYETFVLPLLCAAAVAKPVSHVEKVVIEERAGESCSLVMEEPSEFV